MVSSRMPCCSVPAAACRKAFPTVWVDRSSTRRKKSSSFSGVRAELSACGASPSADAATASMRRFSLHSSSRNEAGILLIQSSAVHSATAPLTSNWRNVFLPGVTSRKVWERGRRSRNSDCSTACTMAPSAQEPSPTTCKRCTRERSAGGRA